MLPRSLNCWCLTWLVVIGVAVITPLFTTAVTCPTLTQSLSLGSRSPHVVLLKRFLYEQKFAPRLLTTTYFGAETAAALKAFQSKLDIVSRGTPSTTGYGATGPKTRAAIVAACSPRPAEPKKLDDISIRAQAPAVVSTPMLRSCTFTPSGAAPVALAHGASVTITNVAGSDCNRQTKACNDGQLVSSSSVVCPAPLPPADLPQEVVPSSSKGVPTCSLPIPAVETRAASCPSGQTGTLTGRRSASCAPGATEPTWSAWSEASRACASSRVSENPPCQLDGQTIPHGSSVSAFQANSVISPAFCTSQLRTCANGTLSGTYTASTCSVVIPSPICTPLPTQTQTVWCLEGLVGSILQTRASSCPVGASAPTWGAWETVSETCAAPTTSTAYAPIDTAQIKNILVYQPGGWSGIDAVSGGDFEWPAYGGKSAYLSRSPDILAHQMALIDDLGDHVAISVLLMNDSDAMASGYGTCWKGSWSGLIGLCKTGTFTKPYAMYDHVREAARSAGVRYVPEFSIMNYADQGNGQSVVNNLKAAVTWLRARLPDAYAAKSPDGRYYIVVDGLPELAGLTTAQKSELIAFMKSQSDMFWLDNLVNADATPSAYSDNMVRTAAADDGAQSSLNSLLGDRYLWWFTASAVVRTFDAFNTAPNKVPEAIRDKWLNISPSSPSKYPVMISQWNEYAEYLIFEPSTRSGTANYDYLKWKLGQQP